MLAARLRLQGKYFEARYETFCFELKSLSKLKVRVRKTDFLFLYSRYSNLTDELYARVIQ